MAKLFGIDIRATVGSVLKGNLRKFVVHKVATLIAADGGTRLLWSDYSAEGVVSRWSTDVAVKRGYPLSAVKILILQHRLGAAPTTDDEITAAGCRWRITDVMQDAGEATWTVAAVPVGGGP